MSFGAPDVTCEASVKSMLMRHFSQLSLILYKAILTRRSRLGNTGSVNSSVGLDPQNLTMSVFSADTLLQGNNALCYGLALTAMEGPDLLSGLYSDI